MNDAALAGRTPSTCHTMLIYGYRGRAKAVETGFAAMEKRMERDSLPSPSCVAISHVSKAS
jgi:hypothetical protein